MNILDVISSNEWQACTSCGNTDFVPAIDGNTLCYDCLGVSFARIPKETTYKKKPIPVSFRWEVFLRDNFTCQNCGSRRNLTVDHIHPEVRGGELTMENAQTLCKNCNSSKGAR